MLRRSLLIGAIMLAALAILGPVSFHTTKHPPHLKVYFELHSLNDGLDRYLAFYGEQVPVCGGPSMIDHLQRVRPQVKDVESKLSASKLDPMSIDDAEVIVLFLSEKLDELLGGPKRSSFEFDVRRMTDSDGDGWYEYNTTEGQIVRYDGRYPSAFCTSIGVWITPEPASRKKPSR